MLGWDTRRICIVCGERYGEIVTADGLVCPSCMPLDLMPQADSMRKHRIIAYCKSHPGWESCLGQTVCERDRHIEERSAAITQYTPSILSDEINAQIETAESIDIVVSFIMVSGLSLIQEKLVEFTKHGRLRVITTAYMGVTEYGALDELFKLPNTEVRMELNCKETARLHAKSFIFNRPDGGSVAFVGSANISKSALTEGEEWVVKLYEKDVPQVLEDLRSSFESLWNTRGIKPVNRTNRAEIDSALSNKGK